MNYSHVNSPNKTPVLFARDAIYFPGIFNPLYSLEKTTNGNKHSTFSEIFL